MSPEMQSDQWRAAIKWGADPPDLDTHVKWGTSTVAWNNRYVGATGPGMAQGMLEVDDTDGYGPETAYMSDVGKCDGESHKCDIKYMINDYDETGSMAQNSEAHVTLYNGDRVAGEWKIMECPDAVSSDGNWWHVFTINSKTNELKWHCQMGPSTHVLLAVGQNNVTADVDFESYVGPFPGRFLRKRNRLARQARELAAKQAAAGAHNVKNLRQKKLSM